MSGRLAAIHWNGTAGAPSPGAIATNPQSAKLIGDIRAAAPHDVWVALGEDNPGSVAQPSRPTAAWNAAADQRSPAPSDVAARLEDRGERPRKGPGIPIVEVRSVRKMPVLERLILAKLE
jgi:hypothetical protein